MDKIPYDKLYVLEHIEFIKNGGILDMLSDETVNNDWMNIGQILFNISEGYIRGLDLWIDFSLRTTEESYIIFWKKECENIWNEMKITNDGTMRDLLNIAKKDNPEMYRIWNKMRIQYALETSIRDGINEYDISKAVHHIYANDFTYSGSKEKIWYAFRNDKWKIINELEFGLFFSENLMNEYRDYYDILTREYQKIIKNDDDEYKLRERHNKIDNKREYQKIVENDDKYRLRERHNKNDIDNKRKKCQAIIMMLKSTSFHKKMIGWCREFFYNKERYEKIRRELEAEKELVNVDENLPDEKIMHIYISSDKINKRCKLGSHEGNIHKLIKRYKTYIPDVNIHYFVPMKNARKIETIFKKNNKEYLVTTEVNNGKTEWYSLDLDTMIKKLKECCS